ncbi:tripartite tricarboxylate transporter substrate binding protein [Paralcaligenes sp. KSB-10]|uniref:Bug family tripartite tricarboxylate transporter substrate binding protein n=1 Tax=Paralcaligenes sp. KSB-10 TaxID=2901142 RepID=UPI001E437756|nr:tripartite tricarboxylate transporter substrate binding protein [Paralcaligenes sp. KSB-10]UHL63897.1 tripartite tricarboxylate transporter substrate binding protein [Paralcaligenes sp. KSB-10]
MRKSILLLSVVLAVNLFLPAAARAEKFPSHSISLIIPTPPGGGTDVALRMVAQIAGGILGQTIVIMNRPGAGGEIGTWSVVRATPDGYTLGGIWNAPLTMTPYTLPAPYTPNDYVAISLTDSAPIVLCAKAAFPADSGKAFIDYLKKNPDKFTYGTDGVGATIQLAAERIFFKLGVKMRSIPFGGAGQTLQSFLGGQIDIYGGSITPILPYVRNKTAKCLIVTSVKRVDSLPEASSLTDLGIPGEQTLLWHGIIGPKGIPPDRLAILESAFRKAAQTKRFVDFMKAQSIDVQGTSGPEMRKVIDSEYAAMGQVVKKLGIGNKK